MDTTNANTKTLKYLEEIVAKHDSDIKEISNVVVNITNHIETKKQDDLNQLYQQQSIVCPVIKDTQDHLNHITCEVCGTFNPLDINSSTSNTCRTADCPYGKSITKENTSI